MKKEFDITDKIKQLVKEGKVKVYKPYKNREEYLKSMQK